MENSVIKVPKHACTGCGACYSKCPTNAIEMVENSEGFLFPEINSEKCIDCGLCYKTCHAVKNVEPSDKARVYAAWANEEIRMKSSSGGFFSVMANYVLENGGAVCGAAFTENYDGAVHCWVEKKEDLQKLRGSKYLQSIVGDTYKQAKEYLDNGRMVLYSGCPCQIAGIKKYLGKDYDNLILVDIVCHGVPSPKAYRAYIKEKAKGTPIVKMDFREKEYWGWGTATSLFMEGGTVYRGDCFKDPYWIGFLSGLITRECCLRCPYAQIHRIGDFTIGDFWGVDAVSKDYDDSKGTSLVMVNNDRASELFERIKGNCVLADEVSVDALAEIAKTRNGQLLHPTGENSKRRRFFELLNTEGVKFTEAFDRANKFDIGYVGWWDSMNYGSALTSFAMNRVLTKMGKSVLMLEHGGISPDTDDYGMQFAKRFYTISKITKEKDYYRFNNACDTFLVGSDQVWNWWNIRHGYWDFFFLNFGDHGHRKIAYASSFGRNDTEYPDYLRVQVGYHLSKFDAISVREKSGVDICKNDFGVEATHVLDPVFLCDMESYGEITSISTIEKPDKYLFSYILDPSYDKVNTVREYAKKLGLPYRIAIDALGDNDDDAKTIIKNMLSDDSNVISGLRIEDWLSYIAGADYVITDSFHGFCFSILYRKNVIAFVNPRRGIARFESIAETTGLSSRMITSSAQAQERNLLETPIDYDDVHARLKPEIERSRKWLTDALKKPPRQPSVQELALWKCIEHDKIIQDNRVAELNSTIAILSARLDELQDMHTALTVKTGDVAWKVGELERKRSLLKRIYRKIFKRKK